MADYERPIASIVSGSNSWGMYGKYNKVLRIDSSSFGGVSGSGFFWNTGSNAGVGAFIRVGSANGQVTMSGDHGNAFSLTELTGGELYEFSPRTITIVSGSVIVLYPKTNGF